MHKYIPFLLLCLSLFYSCKKKNSLTDINRSYCYWNTEFNISHEEDSLLKASKNNHLFIRYFDVDWDELNNKALPISTITIESDTAFLSREFTPTIFITNRVFEKATKIDLDSLAIHIKNRIETVNETAILKYGRYSYSYKTKDGDYQTVNLNTDSLKDIAKQKLQKNFKEVLIDCDWTAQTKSNYFYFLNKLHQQISPKRLSATLRMWQYKYRKTSGIPPTNKCLLMCYNLGDISNLNTSNSIASAKELDSYLIDKPYPLQLDVALPIFSWAVWFRNGSIKGIFNNPDDMESNWKYYDEFKFENENKIIVEKDYSYNAYTYFRAGDEIRIERVKPETIDSMIDLITEKVKLSANSRLSFFSFSQNNINKYGINKINRYYEKFAR